MPRLGVVCTAVIAFVQIPASAQIGSWFGPTNSLNTQIIINHDMMGKMLGKSGIAVDREGYAHSNPGATAYAVSAPAQRQAEAAYVARLSKVDPAGANMIAAQMRAHDFGELYTHVVTPFGLRRGDLADEVTAYTLLGWLIATGAPNPTRAQVHAMRERIAQGLVSEPRFASAATRAQVGEELVISFVTIEAGWGSARNEGKVQAYSDGVAAMFEKQTGSNLRQLVLTDRGLEKRG